MISLPNSRFLKTTLSLLLLFCIGTSLAQENKYNGKKLLIYTKNGEGYVHENIAASVSAIEKICKSMGVESVVSNDPEIFTDSEIMNFDAVIFSNTNNEAFENQDQREAFQNFCRKGKGFGGIHSAIGSERKWPWFWKLIGGSFLRHPPYQNFTVKVSEIQHPSTLHLKSELDTEDECYFIKNINSDIKVLLYAKLSTVSENKNDTISFRPKNAPLSWYNNFQNGRQWYTALGHDKKTYELPWFQKHLQGGIEYLLQD